MKKYLSSYKIGNHGDKLYEMFGENKKIAFISNACDMYTDMDARKLREESDMNDLKGLGLRVEQIDLKNYFGKKDTLENHLINFGGVFVTGGNTFVLAQAYRLSGFGEIMQEYEQENTEFVYSGYSAGICILAPSLKGLDIVDNPDTHVYKETQSIIWEGLGIIDYSISPHYDSEHPESADIDKEIKYCIDNKVLFKALRDGEVIIEL